MKEIENLKFASHGWITSHLRACALVFISRFHNVLNIYTNQLYLKNWIVFERWSLTPVGIMRSSWTRGTRLLSEFRITRLAVYHPLLCREFVWIDERESITCKGEVLWQQDRKTRLHNRNSSLSIQNRIQYQQSSLIPYTGSGVSFFLFYYLPSCRVQVSWDSNRNTICLFSLVCQNNRK